MYAAQPFLVVNRNTILFVYKRVSDECCSCAGFNFGERQTGEVVDNVLLPPWAKSNPRLFILKHRQVCCMYFITITIYGSS